MQTLTEQAFNASSDIADMIWFNLSEGDKYDFGNDYDDDTTHELGIALSEYISDNALFSTDGIDFDVVAHAFQAQYFHYYIDV